MLKHTGFEGILKLKKIRQLDWMQILKFGLCMGIE